MIGLSASIDIERCRLYAAATLRKTKTITEKVEVSFVIHYNTILRATDYKMRSIKVLVIIGAVLDDSFMHSLARHPHATLGPCV
jgi:hypothetical protein